MRSSSTVAVFAGDSLDGTRSYSCIAQRTNAAQTIAASATWPGMANATPVAWTGAVAANQMFRFDLMLTTALSCKVGQGATIIVDAEATVGPTTGKAGIYLDDVSVRIDYVFVVAIGL